MNFMANETAQKLRGGYYTPPDLAGFIARWIAVCSPRRLLEPSCGDGAFLSAIRSVPSLRGAHVVGFELDVAEATKARSRARDLSLSAEVHASDFLAWALDSFDQPKARFDAVIGNPPFIRYQYLPEEFQHRAEDVFGRLGCRFTKHTNAWVPFILASMELLKPGGRLAMVVPAELIHVMHAQSLRTYLAKACSRLVLIDPQEIWFSETLQGAIILLAEKARDERQTREGLGIVPVADREFIDSDPEGLFRKPEALNGKTVQGKWTQAFLGRSTRELFAEVSKHERVFNFTEVADVDVGIVTGANKYFLVQDEVVNRYGLSRWAHPMFGRSEHCPGLIYDQDQHRANAAKGNPTNFLWFEDARVENSSDVRSYIKYGEAQKLHTRYKCRIRAPWYTVPSVYSTKIGMLKRAHSAPRLILNELGAYTTDTAYRITPKNVDAAQLVAAFVNPLTALSAELEGRHYGGGVLELVPSEIERLVIPLPAAQNLDLRKLDRAVRARPLADVLANEGRAPLKALGFGATDIDALFEGWRTLMRRRHRADDDLLEADAD